MRKDKNFTIKGHKKYSNITLHPLPNSSNWQIWFNGRVAYNGNEFSLSEALEHVDTWRRQYTVTEEGWAPLSRSRLLAVEPVRKVSRGRG